MLAVLLAVVGFTALCECQDGITIQIGDRIIPNHGLLTVQDDLFVDPTGTAIDQTVSCRTTYEPCCTDTVPIPTSGMNGDTYFGAVSSGVGSWLYPRSSKPYTIRLLERDILYGITRDDATNSVNLFRSRNDASNVHDGIWRCRIPDANGDEQDVYVGIYDANTPNYGVLSSGSSIQYSEVSADPVMFNLTFDTLGGPATTATWTRDGANISTNSTFATSQIVVERLDFDGFDGLNISTSRYSNRLTVSGRNAGVYGVSVSNVRTSPPVTPNENVAIDLLDFHHPTVTVEHTEDLNGIRVTWSSQLGQRESNVLRDYTVQYTCSPNCPGQTFPTTNTEFTLPNVFLFKTYTFTVMSNFNSISPPMYALPQPPAMGVSVTTQGVLAPVITTPVELLSATSVRVTWTQPVGEVTVEDFVVTYHRTNGREGQCNSHPSSALTMEAQGETSLVISNLEEFSVYEVTVTGRAGGLSNISDPVTFETNSAAPSSAPQSLTIGTTTPTTVSLSWDSVECIHRNGLITHYIISYAPVSDTSLERRETVPSSGQENGGSHTVTGLQPGTNYNFKVAVMTDAGVGVFTAVMQGQTNGVQRPEISSPPGVVDATSVTVSWIQPTGGVTVEDYDIMYRRTSGREGQCSSLVDIGRSVTVSGTSATLPGLEAFSIYQVTVTGRNSRFRISLFNTSEPMEIQTSSTAPSAAPPNLAIGTTTPTTVSLSWDSVECIHRNGLITHYIVNSETLGATVMTSITVTIPVSADGQESGGSYTVAGLQLNTDYSFKVAAVNEAGQGEFSAPLQWRTSNTEPATEGSKCSCTGTIAGVSTLLLLILILVATFGAVILGIWCQRTKDSKGAKGQGELETSASGSLAVPQSKLSLEVIYEDPDLPTNPPPSSSAVQMETCLAYEVLKK